MKISNHFHNWLFIKSSILLLLYFLCCKSPFAQTVAIKQEQRVSIEKEFLIKDSSKYRIGSVSDMFTATMIFQLVEEGKLYLSSSLYNYFTKVPNANHITIANLLNHQSGLYNLNNDEQFIKWLMKPRSMAEIIDFIAASKNYLPTNDKIAYSNTNYILLGYILEKITKKSYIDNLNERIISKVSLLNTKVDSIMGSIPVKVISTPDDISRFTEALFLGKLVGLTSVEQLKFMVDSYVVK